jgi:hypothetical protein
LKKIKKKLELLQKGPWKDLNQSNQVISSRKKKTGEGASRVPAPLVAGGEGQGAREHEWLEAHLLEGLSGARDGRRGLVGEEQSAAAGVNDDGGAPARGWRQEVVG